MEGLNELRQALPAEVEIWAGGANLALARPLSQGIRVIRELSDIATEVTDWRERGRSQG